MNFNNKHIVFIILIIIIIIFILNYDIYIVTKNEEICKPIYITKKDMFSNLNDNEKNIYDIAIEKFKNLNIHENFDTCSTNLDTPSKNLALFTVPGITDPIKKKVIDSVTKVLSYIPTNIPEDTIKEIIEYFAILYQTSSCIDIFYKNVHSSLKIDTYPYNSKYSHLVLFLIGKFDSDINTCEHDKKINSVVNTETEIEAKLQSISCNCPAVIQNYIHNESSPTSTPSTPTLLSSIPTLASTSTPTLLSSIPTLPSTSTPTLLSSIPTLPSTSVPILLSSIPTLPSTSTPTLRTKPSSSSIPSSSSMTSSSSMPSLRTDQPSLRTNQQSSSSMPSLRTDQPSSSSMPSLRTDQPLFTRTDQPLFTRTPSLMSEKTITESVKLRTINENQRQQEELEEQRYKQSFKQNTLLPSSSGLFNKTTPSSKINTFDMNGESSMKNASILDDRYSISTRIESRNSEQNTTNAENSSCCSYKCNSDKLNSESNTLVESFDNLNFSNYATF